MSATNRGAVRNKNDLYETPLYAIDLIKQEIDWNKVDVFLEPCYGSGAIWREIHVMKKFCWEINFGLDYLKDGHNGFVLHHGYDVGLIITNPPFSLAEEFIDRSLDDIMSLFGGLTVIMLLRINFLGSQKRRKWWQGKEPTHLFVLSKRPSFNGDGKTDATEYAWFCWDHAWIIKRNPGVYVI